jgi:hypothetical protein
MPKKTKDVARELGISVLKLRAMLQNEKLEPPPKDSSGDYVWTDADVERARVAAQTDRRRRRPAAPAETVGAA